MWTGEREGVDGGEGGCGRARRGYRTALVWLAARLARLLVLVLLVTRCRSREEDGAAAGTSERRVVSPRRSCGSDWNHTQERQDTGQERDGTGW